MIKSYPIRLLNSIKKIYYEDGLNGVIKRVPVHIRNLYLKTTRNEKKSYQEYIKSVEPLLFKNKLENPIGNYSPRISIIMPLYNVELEYLKEAVDSVINQSYDNWELCIHDDRSTKYLDSIDYIEELSADEGRIKFSKGKINQNISGASNEALKLATGEFLVLIDNDDVIDPRALELFVRELNKNRNLKYIYSDFDKLDPSGIRIDPTFKPDWSPNLLLSMMYTNHLQMFNTERIRSVGGFRKGFEGSQDHDLVLRYTEGLQKEEIYHIPLVLYHWRQIEGSTSFYYEDKPTTSKATKRAITDAVSRRELNANVVDGYTNYSFRVNYQIQNHPKVSIIIPTKNLTDLLKVNINSILDRTAYKNFEIIVVDNLSDEEESKVYLDEIDRHELIKVIDYPEKYNFSAINNLAAKKAQGDHLLFLNNDIEIINKGWMGAMLQFSQRESIGAVGSLLLYPDDKIQHAGIVIGIGDVAGHVYRGIDKDQLFHWNRTHVIREVSAVTAAALMVKKDLFWRVGGFDEKLGVAYNDIDLCLKFEKEGFSNIYTPFSKLYHYEQLSRGSDESGERLVESNKEKDYLYSKWGSRLKFDPFYNPNLSNHDESAAIRTEPII